MSEVPLQGLILVLGGSPFSREQGTPVQISSRQRTRGLCRLQARSGRAGRAFQSDEKESVGAPRSSETGILKMAALFLNAVSYLSGN